MLNPGMYVRVKYPEYAANFRGYLVTQEPSGRWLVRLESNPLKDSQEPLLLSLEESELEVIEPETTQETSD
jgi:hypothetical protein